MAKNTILADKSFPNKQPVFFFFWNYADSVKRNLPYYPGSLYHHKIRRFGIVEIGKSIEGVEVSIFLYEKEKGYKASLRSNEYVNVSEVCLMFGGGGHIKAAGANMNMPLEEAKKAIITEATKYLK